MPRPPDPQVPERILEAAMAVVEGEGHEALSMRALARDAGVSTTTIYAHFESKEALIRALEVRAAQMLNARIRAIDPSLGPHEALAELGRRYIAFAEEHPRAYHLLFESPGWEDPTEEEQRILYFTYHAARNALERAAAAGEVPFPPALGAMMGWAMLHGFSSLLLSRRLHFAEGLDTVQLKAAFMSVYAHQPPVRR